MNPVMQVRPVEGREDHYALWCPGCDDLHMITAAWTWDGNLEAPTFDPSILCTGGPGGDTYRCHSFLKAGVWEYLTDCSHAMAGQRVPMVPIPDWLNAE